MLAASAGGRTYRHEWESHGAAYAAAKARLSRRPRAASSLVFARAVRSSPLASSARVAWEGERDWTYRDTTNEPNDPLAGKGDTEHEQLARRLAAERADIEAELNRRWTELESSMDEAQQTQNNHTTTAESDLANLSPPGLDPALVAELGLPADVEDAQLAAWLLAHGDNGFSKHPLTSAPSAPTPPDSARRRTVRARYIDPEEDDVDCGENEEEDDFVAEPAPHRDAAYPPHWSSDEHAWRVSLYDLAMNPTLAGGDAELADLRSRQYAEARSSHAAQQHHTADAPAWYEHARVDQAEAYEESKESYVPSFGAYSHRGGVGGAGGGLSHVDEIDEVLAVLNEFPDVDADSVASSDILAHERATRRRRDTIGRARRAFYERERRDARDANDSATTARSTRSRQSMREDEGAVARPPSRGQTRGQARVHSRSASHASHLRPPPPRESNHARALSAAAATAATSSSHSRTFTPAAPVAARPASRPTSRRTYSLAPPSHGLDEFDDEWQQHEHGEQVFAHITRHPHPPPPSSTRPAAPSPTPPSHGDRRGQDFRRASSTASEKTLGPPPHTGTGTARPPQRRAR